VDTLQKEEGLETKNVTRIFFCPDISLDPGMDQRVIILLGGIQTYSVFNRSGYDPQIDVSSDADVSSFEDAVGRGVVKSVSKNVAKGQPLQ
jgi:hypothetical protein